MSHTDCSLCLTTNRVCSHGLALQCVTHRLLTVSHHKQGLLPWPSAPVCRTQTAHCVSPQTGSALMAWRSSVSHTDCSLYLTTNRVCSHGLALQCVTHRLLTVSHHKQGLLPWPSAPVCHTQTAHCVSPQTGSALMA